MLNANVKSYMLNTVCIKKVRRVNIVKYQAFTLYRVLNKFTTLSNDLYNFIRNICLPNSQLDFLHFSRLIGLSFSVTAFLCAGHRPWATVSTIKLFTIILIQIGRLLSETILRLKRVNEESDG